MPGAGGRAGPVVIWWRAISHPQQIEHWGEQAQHLTSQHNRANPENDNCLHYSPDLWCHGKKRVDSPINTWDRMQSCSCGHKCGRAIPVSHQLQHSGRQLGNSPGQYNRANPLSTDIDDSVSTLWQWESCSYLPSSKTTLQLAQTK